MNKDFNSSNKQMDEQFRVQNILLKISQSIIGTLDYEEVLQHISDGMAELLGIETGAIYLLEDNDHLYLGATTPALDPNMPDTLRRASVSDHPHIEMALKSKRPQFIYDSQIEKLSPNEAAVVEMRNLRSILYFPFIQKDKTLGVLILSTVNKLRKFTEDEINLGQTVANQLSIGIQNALLHNRLDKYNKQLEKEIKHRKQVEKALKISQNHLSNALRLAKLGHWEYDVKTEIFNFTNEFFEIYKTNVEEVGSYQMSADEYAEKFVYPEDQHLVKKEIVKILSADDPEYGNQLEHRITYFNGETGNTLVRYRSEKDSEGNTIRIYGANQDITDVKKAQEELLSALEKAEESDRLKSSFLANVSHEIRTPMNAILGFSDLLQMEDVSPQEKENFVGHIQSGGRKLLRIIADLLDISKIDAKSMTIEDEEFSLNKLIDDLGAQFDFQIPDKNIRIITCKSLKDEASFINSDLNRLSQVYSNLIENAIKFTNEGEIKFGYEYNQNKFLFFVKDTGIGIKEKDHKIIFERFRQVENRTNTVVSGTGLGLSIVKSIVELMQGEIWIESEPGRGSTFYFSLPVTPLKQLSPVEKKTKSRTLKYDKKIKIIIAEDEITNYYYLEAILEPYDFIIIHALDGIEAVEKYNEHPDTNLILMDIKMPRLNGIEATKKIRQTSQEIPIIAQTAYTLTSDRKIAIKAGCTDYMTKPIDINVLLNTIHRLTQ